MYTFLVFSRRLQSGGSKRTDVSRFPAQIKVVRSPLDIYTIPLTSKAYEHLTTLSITTDFAVPELVQLSSVTNLVSLEINSPASQVTAVSDRLLHAWHLKSQESRAFSVLRILKLHNHPELTKRSLPYINSFPSLALYDVGGCNVDLLHGTLAGWQATQEPNLLHLLEAMCHKPPRSTSDLGRYNAWDSEIHKMLWRIDEIRGEKDRKNVPITSLRLGEVPWPAIRPSIAFIRKRMSDGAKTGKRVEESKLRATQSTASSAVASTSYEAVSTTTRPARPLTRRKKRNLDDMLNSFI